MMEAQTQKRRINQIFLSADHKRNTAPESTRTHHLALEDGRHIVDLRSTNEATIIEADAGADFSQVPEMDESEAAEIVTAMRDAGEIDAGECDIIHAELHRHAVHRARKTRPGYQAAAGLWNIPRKTIERLLKFPDESQNAIIQAAIAYIARSDPGDELPHLQPQEADEMLRELLTGEQTAKGGE